MSKKNQTKGLDGCYKEVGHPSIRIVVQNGKYRWGSKEVHDYGTYTAMQTDEFTCVIKFASELFKDLQKKCRLTRCGKTYTLVV